MLRLTYEEYRTAVDKGEFKEDQLEKEVLLKEDNAKKLGITQTIKICMQYTLDNSKEVIFKYKPMIRSIYDDVFIGDERRCNAFYTQEQLRTQDQLATFHTHAFKEGDGFGILDMKDFSDPRYGQMMVGCPATRKIYLLKKSIVIKHPKTKVQIEKLYQKGMILFKKNFRTYNSITQFGKVIITEEGKIADYKYVAKLMKILDPVLTIINW